MPTANPWTGKKKSTPDELVVYNAIINNPMFVPQDCIGHDHWPIAERMIRAISKPRARVAVKACHASSKTFTAADIFYSFILSGGSVVTTSSTWLQVKKELWGEIRRAHEESLVAIGGELLQTEFKISNHQWGIGLSTNRGVNFQGFHAAANRKMLIIIDEASGVEGDIWEAIEGIRAGGDVRILALANPTIPSGDFYEIFRDRSSRWDRITINAFETPNFKDELHPGRQITLEELLAMPEDRLTWSERPYLITRDWVREKYDEWGITSPRWQARVIGEFPDQAPDALIRISDIEHAILRDTPDQDDWVWEAGIDVAGPGEDETVTTVRHGPKMVFQKPYATEDPRGEVLADLLPYRDLLIGNRSKKTVKVDSIGMGYYFARHLEDQGFRGVVADINVALPSDNSEQFLNLRAEYYWGLRQRFQQNDIEGEIDDVSFTQLAAIKYEHTARGQIKITDKAKLPKSPDRAESIMLCFAKPRDYSGTPVTPISMARSFSWDQASGSL